MPGRNFSILTSSYRYGYNGKERDKDISDDTYDYGMRISDQRIARFLSVDPITSKYPELTPYQYASNRPIEGIDLDGLEFISNKVLRQNTPGRIILYNSVRIAQKVQNKWNNSRPGRFTNGLVNTTFGVIGTIASVSYIAETGGAGATFGGATALMLSLGEVGIGVTQMTDAIAGKQNGSTDALHNSSSIPGLIAYGTGSQYAPFIDAFSQFSPTIATSLSDGSFKMLFNKSNFLGLRKAFTEFTNDGTILNYLGFLDQLQDASGFVVNSANLFNEFTSKGHLKWQLLKYTLSYSVKEGDNLTKIAKELNTTVKELQKQNNLKNPDQLDIGQELKFSGTIYGDGDYGGGGAGGKF